MSINNSPDKLAKKQSSTFFFRLFFFCLSCCFAQNITIFLHSVCVVLLVFSEAKLRTKYHKRPKEGYPY